MDTRVKYRIDFNGGNQWFLVERSKIESAVKELRSIRQVPEVYEVTEILDKNGTVIDTQDKKIEEKEL